MTQDHPTGSASGLTRHRPSAEDRLAAPPKLAAPATAPDPTRTSKLASVTALLTSKSKPEQPAAAAAPAGSRTMTSRRKLTPIKRIERYVSAIFKLGRTEHMAKDGRKRIARAELRMDDIESELGRFGDDIREIWHSSGESERRISELRNMLQDTGAMGSKLLDDIALLQQRLDQHHVLTDSLVHEFRNKRALLQETLRAETSLMARVFADLSRRVDMIGQRTGIASEDLSTPGAQIDLPASEGFEAFKDSFYHRLENRYRGSVEEIADRLRIYLPDVEAAVMRSGGKPVMDIGCGRGEWLGLLKRAGIEGFGVDTNAVQIEAAKEQGLDVRLGDALKALAEMEDNSLAMISAHHLVEHLPFDAVAWIAREALRVLAPGGILLFETPHTRNVLVGATTFHTDPTHLKPMPEQVLTVLYDTAGFDPVEVRALNPHTRFKEFLDTPDFNDELAFLLFGPQDLAVLGTKPAPKDEE
ncbi:class I SAM-dependent methyltransferase [Marivita lacus]|nr:class I SAM-dependent methyltransferase [Marivita lacus]